MLFTFLIASSISMVAATPTKRPTESRALETTVNVAVTDLSAKEGLTKSMAELMSDLLRTQLFETGVFAVMNREDQQSILKEIKFQQTGACDSASCLVEMGQALGVEKIVSGSVGIIEGTYAITAKLVDIRTMRSEILVSELYKKDSENDLQDVFSKIARRLAGLQEGPSSIKQARGQAALSSRLSVFTSKVYDLYLDDTKIGQTPFNGRVKSGSAKISLREGGFIVYEWAVVLSEGASTSLNASEKDIRKHASSR